MLLCLFMQIHQSEMTKLGLHNLQWMNLFDFKDVILWEILKLPNATNLTVLIKVCFEI